MSMTTEQREVIDRFKHLLNLKYTPFNGGRNVLINKEEIDTVLSLIKEQQEEIGSLQKELEEESRKKSIELICYQKELENSIPKQVVIHKIKDLQYNNSLGFEETLEESFKIQVLQELLEGSE